MLEQALAENTAAIRELLTLIRNNSREAFSNADGYSQQKAISDEPPLSPSETKAAAAAILAEAKKTTTPAPILAQAAEDTVHEGIKYEAVVAVVQRMAGAGKRDLVVNALAALGCATARNLQADQYGEFLEMLNKASA